MKKSRIFFIAGILLILFAIYNIVMMNVSKTDDGYSSLINQEGFVPILAAEESAADDGLLQRDELSRNIPDRIIIPEINLDAPVVIARAVTTTIDKKEYVQFLVPEKFAAGFHENSAPLGEMGNTVLSGHHNAYGEVFANLYKLKTGDIINLYSKGTLYQYIVTNTMILKEKDEPLDVRLENARWILPSDDERLTLVTCWPHESNTHRLIVVAIPLQNAQAANTQTPCDDDEINSLLQEYLEAYLKSSYYMQTTSLHLNGERQLILNLQGLNKDIEQLDANKCLLYLEDNLMDYVDALILKAGFDQAAYQGEEYKQVNTLLASYQTLLESYFQSYDSTIRTDMLHSFENQDFSNPTGQPATINATNSADKSLNIREKATANSRFLGSLPSGNSTVVIGKSLDENWLLIPFKDGLGWINAEYTQLNTPMSMIPFVLNQVIEQDGN